MRAGASRRAHLVVIGMDRRRARLLHEVGDREVGEALPEVDGRILLGELRELAGGRGRRRAKRRRRRRRARSFPSESCASEGRGWGAEAPQHRAAAAHLGEDRLLRLRHAERREGREAVAAAARRGERRVRLQIESGDRRRGRRQAAPRGRGAPQAARAAASTQEAQHVQQSQTQRNLRSEFLHSSSSGDALARIVDTSRLSASRHALHHWQQARGKPRRGDRSSRSRRRLRGSLNR